jgi:hypothetical protein
VSKIKDYMIEQEETFPDKYLTNEDEINYEESEDED